MAGRARNFLVGLFLSGLALTLYSGTTIADGTERAYCAAFAEQLIPTRTPPEQEITEVLVGIWPMDIGDFDDRNQTFFADFYIALKWRDPRLIFNGLTLFDPVGVEINAAPDECDIHPRWMTEESRIWWPNLEFQSLRGERDLRAERLLVYSDGDVYYEARISGTFKTQFDFTNFPFDRQTVPLTVLPYNEVDHVVLAAYEDYFEGLDEDALLSGARALNISGWNIIGVSTVTDEADFGSETYSRFTYSIEVERIATAMIFSFILPVILITLLASAAFWVEFDRLDIRTSLSVTAVLTLVAFNLVLRDRLPDLPYATLADIVNSISLLYTIVAVLAVVLLHFILLRRPDTMVVRVDGWVRIGYPLSYLILVTGIIAHVL